MHLKKKDQTIRVANVLKKKIPGVPTRPFWILFGPFLDPFLTFFGPIFKPRFGPVLDPFWTPFISSALRTSVKIRLDTQYYGTFSWEARKKNSIDCSIVVTNGSSTGLRAVQEFEKIKSTAKQAYRRL